MSAGDENRAALPAILATCSEAVRALSATALICLVTFINITVSAIDSMRNIANTIERMMTKISAAFDIVLLIN